MKELSKYIYRYIMHMNFLWERSRILIFPKHMTLNNSNDAPRDDRFQFIKFSLADVHGNHRSMVGIIIAITLFLRQEILMMTSYIKQAVSFSKQQNFLSVHIMFCLHYFFLRWFTWLFFGSELIYFLLFFTDLLSDFRDTSNRLRLFFILM